MIKVKFVFLVILTLVFLPVSMTYEALISALEHAADVIGGLAKEGEAINQRGQQ